MKILTMLNRMVAGALVMASLALMTGGCGLGSPIEQGRIQRVIVVVVDTLRGDHLACTGGPVATPNLDALAAKGVLFSQARTHIPITGPSHSTLFTGLLPSDHGVLNNTQVLAQGFDTLPEMAQARGMRTAAFISLGVLTDKFGLDQGFDEYFQRFQYSWNRNAGEMNEDLIPWIDDVGGKEPFFLWAHYSDPHAPYAAPGKSYATCRVEVDGEEVAIVEADGKTVSIPVPLVEGRCSVTMEYTEDCEIRPKKLAVEGLRTAPRQAQILPGRHFVRAPQEAPIFLAKPPAHFEVVTEDSTLESIDLRFSLKHKLTHAEVPAQYGFEVEYVDREVGRLLDAVENRGWTEDTLIVFVSDHGEGIGEHNLVGHIEQLYDSLLHVPLIMVAPGHLPDGLVVDAPVSLVDILPTIAELAGISPPEGIRGRSLVPLMEPGGSLPDQPHVALTARPQADSDLEAVVVDGWKLIRKRETGEVALFDLGVDPHELTDVASEYPEEVSRLDQILDENLISAGSAGAWAELDDESRSRLEALGYVN